MSACAGMKGNKAKVQTVGTSCAKALWLEEWEETEKSMELGLRELEQRERTLRKDEGARPHHVGLRGTWPASWFARDSPQGYRHHRGGNSSKSPLTFFTLPKGPGLGNNSTGLPSAGHAGESCLHSP